MLAVQLELAAVAVAVAVALLHTAALPAMDAKELPAADGDAVEVRVYAVGEDFLTDSAVVCVV
jgi:hypothetical protein